MKLAIVVPCFNEEAVLQETTQRLLQVHQQIRTIDITSDCQIYYIDDGSKDSTWSLIEQLQEQNSFVHGIKLAHNVGHQNAVWAGLEYVADKCDAAVSIDADMQDDVNCIIEMYNLADREDYEVVYGVRKERKTDTIFKRSTAIMFYKLMQVMGVDIVYNHADFRFMSRRVIESLMQYPERNIFLRGIVPLIGFKHTNIYYDRAERFAGESKYPFSKMLNFAIDGITSFSIKPLRIIAVLGVLMLLISMIAAIYVLLSYFYGWAIAGWSSMLLSIWFLGGVQLLSIGVLGEYIGKTYKEVKRRPRYFVETTI